VAVVEVQPAVDQRARVGQDLPLPEDQLGSRWLKIALIQRQPAIALAQGHIADLDAAVDETKPKGLIEGQRPFDVRHRETGFEPSQVHARCPPNSMAAWRA
jgi:hypothetical protein